MISINATLIVQIIHILILIFILNRLLFKPILKLTKERSSFFTDTKEEIKKLEQETADLKNRFSSMQNDARKDAALEREKLKNLGHEEAEAFLSESKKEAGAIRAEADQKADQEIESTRPAISDEAVVLVDDIIEKVIGRRIEA